MHRLDSFEKGPHSCSEEGRCWRCGGRGGGEGEELYGSLAFAEGRVWANERAPTELETYRLAPNEGANRQAGIGATSRCAAVLWSRHSFSVAQLCPSRPPHRSSNPWESLPKIHVEWSTHKSAGLNWMCCCIWQVDCSVQRCVTMYVPERMMGSQTSEAPRRFLVSLKSSPALSIKLVSVLLHNSQPLSQGTTTEINRSRPPPSMMLPSPKRGNPKEHFPAFRLGRISQQVEDRWSRTESQSASCCTPSIVTDRTLHQRPKLGSSHTTPFSVRHVHLSCLSYTYEFLAGCFSEYWMHGLHSSLRDRRPEQRLPSAYMWCRIHPGSVRSVLTQQGDHV